MSIETVVIQLFSSSPPFFQGLMQLPAMKITSDLGVFERWHEAGGGSHVAAADVRIVTSGGCGVLAHSSVLASASPVLESKLDRQWNLRKSLRVIHILGVPCDAVVAFVGFLYSSKSSLTFEDSNEAMEKYGVHLLVLSHSYRVAWLKKVCEDGLASQLTAEKVVDMLQIARSFDAPRLYQKCLHLIAKDFDYVQQTEAWRFLQNHDLGLEFEILQFLQEADQRKIRRRRQKEEQKIYEQLNEAMECLHHICTEGCTEVGPVDAEPKNKGPCTHFRTCQTLQLLIRHFARCCKKLNCPHCKRMSQLFRLHSSICDLPIESCEVPLCMQFKFKFRMKEDKGDDETWRLLVKKVRIARVVSIFTRRKTSEQLQKMWARYRKTR